MKIEDIEDAALDCALFEDYYYNPELQPAYIDGFKRGTKWRIDSVWHYIDKKEIPECFKPILLEYKEQGIPLIKVAIRDHYDDSFFMEGWIRWAYVEDLLPNKQE